MEREERMNRKKEKSIERRIFLIIENHLENNVCSKTLYILLILVETLQIGSCILFLNRSSADEDFSLVEEILYPFNFVSYILYNSSLNTFQTIYGIMLFFFILHMCLLLMTGILTLHKKQAHTSFLNKIVFQMSSSLCILFKTILPIPMSQLLFSSIFLCSMINVECFQASHLTLTILSVLTFPCFIISIVILSLFSDSYIKSPIPWAGPSNILLIIRDFIKIMLGFSGALCDSFQFPSGQLIIGSCFIFANYLLYQRYRIHAYFDSGIRNVLIFQEMVLYALLLTICIVNSYGRTFKLQYLIMALFMGIVCAVNLALMKKKRVEGIALKNVDNIKEDWELEIYFLMIYDLPKTVIKDPYHRYILNRALYLHREQCLETSCICRDFNKFQIRKRARKKEEEKIGHSRKDEGKVQSKTSETGINIEERVLLLNEEQDNGFTEERKRKVQEEKETIEAWNIFIGQTIDEKLEKSSSKSFRLRIFNSYFQQLVLNNLYKSFFQILKATEYKTTQRQRFILQQMKVFLDKLIYLQETHSAVQSVDLDLRLFIKFDRKRRKFLKLMEDITVQILVFWNLLLSINLQINKLYALGMEISKKLKSLDRYYRGLIGIFSDHIETYKCYGEFLQDVSKNEVEGMDVIEKGEAIQRNVLSSKLHAFETSALFSINSKTGIIIVSGNLQTLGRVKQVNEFVYNILEYTSLDLVGYTVSRIMPRAIGVLHNSFLLSFFKTGQNHVMGKDTFVFAQSKSGFLVPLLIVVKTMPGLAQGLEYIAFFTNSIKIIKRKFLKLPYELQKKKICFILTDKNSNILGISKAASDCFFIPQSYFERKNDLFLEPVNVEKLNALLVSEQVEKELIQNGMRVTVDPEVILQSVDQDFLELNEQLEMAKSLKLFQAYFKLIILKIKSGLVLKAYLFIVTKKRLEIDNQEDNIGMRDMFDKDFEKKIDYDALNLSINISVANTATTASTQISGKDNIFALKKSMLGRTKPLLVNRLEKTNFIAFFLLMLLSFFECITFFVSLQETQDVVNLEVSALQRRSLIANTIENFEDYLEILNGQEHIESCPECGDRLETVYTQLLEEIELMKQNEYNFNELYQEAKIDGIEDLFRDPTVSIERIDSDYTITESQHALTFIIIQLTTKVLHLLKELPSEDLITDFIKNLEINNIEQLKNEDPLSEAEIEAFFILVNGLDNLITPSEEIIWETKNYLDTTLNNKEILLEGSTINIIVFICLYVLMTIPILKNIQKGKRGVLLFFAELTQKEVSEIVVECEGFYNMHFDQGNKEESGRGLRSQGTIYRANTDTHSEEGPGFGTKLRKLKQSSSSRNIRSRRTLKKLNTEEMEEKKSLKEDFGSKFRPLEHIKKREEFDSEEEVHDKEIKGALINMAPSQIKNDGPGEGGKENEKDNAEQDQDQQSEDKYFVNERKKKFQKYKAETGKIFFFILFGFAIIIGGKILLYFYQIHLISTIQQDNDYLNIFHQRFTVYPALLLYYNTAARSNRKCPVFEDYSEKVLENDKEMDIFLKNPGDAFAFIAQIIQEHNSNDFCDLIINQQTFHVDETYEDCVSIQNEVLQKGMRNALSYISTTYMTEYLKIDEDEESVYEKPEFLDINRALVQQYFDIIFRELNENMHEKFQSCIDSYITVSIYYQALQFIIFLAALYANWKFVICKIREEIHNAKGILNLLPTNLILANNAISQLIRSSSIFKD